MNTNERKLDTRALCLRILEEYGTIKAFCKAAKMKQDTLVDKLEGKRCFAFTEMERIVSALHLNRAEVDRCFFTYGEYVSRSEIQLAEEFLKLDDEKQSVFLNIMNLIRDNPARCDFVENWKGNYKDLQAALVQI